MRCLGIYLSCFYRISIGDKDEYVGDIFDFVFIVSPLEIKIRTLEIESN